jgi:hypothetical protein
MRIRMNQTVRLLGTYPLISFHKGTSYEAVPAVNQPNHQAKQLVFAQKRNGQSMLLSGERKEFTVL